MWLLITQCLTCSGSDFSQLFIKPNVLLNVKPIICFPDPVSLGRPRETGSGSTCLFQTPLVELKIKIAITSGHFAGRLQFELFYTL